MGWNLKQRAVQQPREEVAAVLVSHERRTWLIGQIYLGQHYLGQHSLPDCTWLIGQHYLDQHYLGQHSLPDRTWLIVCALGQHACIVVDAHLVLVGRDRIFGIFGPV